MSEEGPNLLSAHGAATMIGRDGAQVQIRITCGSEDEAKAIIDNFRANIEHHGYAVMHFGGTIDDGKKN